MNLHNFFLSNAIASLVVCCWFDKGNRNEKNTNEVDIYPQDE